MSTVEIKNSLEQDKHVNSEQSQFTSSNVEQKKSNTSFVSQFETATPKKEKNTTVKLSDENEVVAFIGP